MKPELEPKPKDEGPQFELRQLYGGFGEPLKLYLQTRLQPWRWPIMLSTGAIRVERGGKARPDLKLEYGLSTSDVIVIDDAYGETWRKLMREATVNFRDYVFCPQRGRDLFLLDQVKALLMEKTARDIPLKHNNVDILNLYALIANLIPIADHPIRYLIIVTHASEFGELLLPMRNEKRKDKPTDPDDETARYVTWESLQEAIALKDKNPLFIHDHSHLVDGPLPPRRSDGTQDTRIPKVLPPRGVDGQQDNRFPKILPRPERSDGKFVPFAVIIRGCSSGVHTISLNKVREALGYMVDIVVMPKWFDATARRGREMFEYFQHHFEVSSHTALKRDELIQKFKDAKFRDWLGASMPDSEWDTLVPRNVQHQESTPVREMRVRVKGRDEPLVISTGFDSGAGGIGPQIMKQEEKPDAAAIQEFLITSLTRIKAFNNGTGDWPMWKRMDLGSLTAFAEHYTYELYPWKKSGPNNWHVHSKRHYYQVRTPLIEKGLLVADYHPGRDGAEPTRLINYNDDRIFGRSDPTKPDPNFPRVGKNFSRLL